MDARDEVVNVRRVADGPDQTRRGGLRPRLVAEFGNPLLPRAVSHAPLHGVAARLVGLEGDLAQVGLHVLADVAVDEVARGDVGRLLPEDGRPLRRRLVLLVLRLLLPLRGGRGQRERQKQCQQKSVCAAETLCRVHKFPSLKLPAFESNGFGGVDKVELTVEALPARLRGDAFVPAVGAEHARLHVVAQVR